MDIRRQAWELKQQGYSYAEIAEKLGIGKSTAHKYVKEWEEVQKNEPPSDFTHDDRIEATELTVERNAIPPELQNYVESGETKLKVVGVEDVVKEINSKITVVEEPKIRTEKVQENESLKDKAVNTLSRNKFMFALALISLAVIAGAMYVYFFRRKSKTDSKQIIEEVREEVTEKRTNPLTDSTYERLKRIGIDKTAVL